MTLKLLLTDIKIAKIEIIDFAKFAALPIFDVVSNALPKMFANWNKKLYCNIKLRFQLNWQFQNNILAEKM